MDVAPLPRRTPLNTPLPFVAAAAVVFLSSGACRADGEREANARFKGVELYSWKDASGDWVFALLDGTNREKTEKEVKATRNPIKGVANLKKALGRLAEGEQVSWTHRTAGFAFPPKKTRNEIAAAARKAKVSLHTSADDR